jgi:hypothetical protein
MRLAAGRSRREAHAARAEGEKVPDYPIALVLPRLPETRLSCTKVLVRLPLADGSFPDILEQVGRLHTRPIAMRQLGLHLNYRVSRQYKSPR